MRRRAGWSAALLLAAIACGQSHEGDAAGADGGRRDGGPMRVDAGPRPLDSGPALDLGRCDPEPPPETTPATDLHCATPFHDADCDGDPDFVEGVCPRCPALPADAMEGMACEAEGYTCEYAGPGFCNFWGCDCSDANGDGELEWTCWFPLC